MTNEAPKVGRILNVSNGEPLVGAVVDVTRQIRTRDPFERIVVVAPSLTSRFYLRRAVTDHVCNDDHSGLFNVEFMRIEEVADRIFEATNDGQQKPPMSRLIASEMIYNAASQLTTRGPLTEHANNESTLDAIQRTLQELERLESGAESALDRLAGDANAGLFRQLSEIQRRYSAQSAEFLTRENRAALAAESVGKNPGILAAILAKHIIVVSASVPPDAYSRLRDAIDAVPSVLQLRIVPTEQDIENCDTETPATRFYSTMGAADEPRAVIRNIIADARAGIRFGEMAVLYPSNDYASRIKDALDDAGIKNCGPTTRTLADTPVGKFVSLLLEMIAAEFRRDAFTAWTTSAPVVDPSTGDRVPAVPWEVASRNAKISRFAGDDRWQRSLNRYANAMRRRATRAERDPDEYDHVDPESMRTMAVAAEHLVDFISRLSDRADVEDARTWNDWVSWLEVVIADYLAPRSADSSEANGMDRISSELSAVKELDSVGTSRVEFSRFSRTVQRLLRGRLSGGSGWGVGVFVAPIDDIVGTAFRAVHVLGMSEGGLPKTPRSDPLLADHLRRDLDPDGSRLPTKVDRLEFERHLFRMTLACAPSKRLYWNKALHGATSESYPSPWFVDEVIKTNGLASVPVKVLMDPRSEYVESVHSLSDLVNAEAAAPSEYEFNLRQIASNAGSDAKFETILTDPSNSALASGFDVVSARRSTTFGHHDGNVVDARLWSRHSLHLSASGLQNYAECPYRYYLATELNVDERIDPEDSLTLSAMDRGLLVHSILERFLKDFGPDPSSRGLDGLREVANSEFDRFQREDYIGYAPIFTLEKAQILRQLERWHQTNLDVLINYDGEMMTEVPFGFGDALGRMEFEDGFSFQFRGMIDLIALSTSRDRALVVDFKTGSSNRYSDIEKDVTAAGTKLQLPLYARVGDEILANVSEIEAAYWFVFQQGGTRLRPRNPVALEETRERFADVMKIVVGGIRNGVFPARPGVKNAYGDGAPWENCKYCAYSDVCASDRLIAWDRKKFAPELDNYVELSEGLA